MEQKTKQEMHAVTALIPTPIRQLVEKLATDEERSTSQIVRRLLEESPRVKAELRRQRARNAA